MAIIPGTIPVTGTFAPTDTIDTFAIMDMQYVFDGLRNVANKTERNAITDERRKEGMIVGTQDTSEYWRLLASPWTGTDTDWELFIAPNGASNLGALDDVTLVSPIMDGDTLIYNISTGQWENSDFVNIYNANGTIYENRVIGIDNGSVVQFDSTTGPVTGLLTLDSFNNRVGIGTAVPGYELHVGNGSAFIQGGSLAVGGTAPTPEIKGRFVYSNSDDPGGSGEKGALRLDASYDTTIGSPNVYGLSVRSTFTKLNNSNFKGVDVNFGVGGANSGIHEFVGFRAHMKAAQTGTASITNIGIVSHIYPSNPGTHWLAQFKKDGVNVSGKVLAAMTADGKVDWVDASTLVTEGGEDLAATLAIGNTTNNGQTIDSLNGDVRLNLREGFDNIFSLTNDNGVYAKAWFYGDTLQASSGFNTTSIQTFNEQIVATTDYNYAGDHAFHDITPTGYRMIVSDAVTGRRGEILLGNNSVGFFIGSNVDQFATTLSSRFVTVNTGVYNSVALGGVNLKVQTANTAYVTQLGYSNKNIVGNYETILNFTTPTTNRTQTFQDADGDIMVGPQFNPLVANPNIAQDGYVLKWNNSAGEYQLVADAVGTTPSLSAVLAVGNTTNDGQTINSFNGGGQLDLRQGADNVIALTNANGAYTKAWFYGDDSVAQFGFGSSYFGVGGGSTPSIGSFLGGARSVVTYDNSGGSTPVPLFEGTKYPTIISSQLSDVNVSINNTVVLGGNNINGKTSNTAYVNQIGFNKSSAFETILVHTTPTADRTITFQDATGTVPVGPAWDTLIANPTIAQDGYVIAWNNTNNEYELVPDASGSNTLDELTDVSLSSPITDGEVLTYDSGSGTWTNEPLPAPSIQIMTPDDKFLLTIATASDGDATSASAITNTPVDGCYVSVYVNGIEYEVGNGVKTTTCYFSGDGGTTARGFSSTHPNGRVQAGDICYWNGSIIGFELKAGWRLAFHYLV